MRFKKGDKVEVMDSKDVPVSWRAAEILSCIGHTYRVQYDSYPGMASNQMVEMVPLKFLRPRPPLVQGVESCIAGDIVEVFYEYSWMIAAILKVPGVKKTNKRNKINPQDAAFQNQYLVRLLGCSQELVIDRSDIRMRQTWHDDKWILMGKSSQAGDDVISSKPSTSNCCAEMNFQVPQLNARAKSRPRKYLMNIQDNAALLGSAATSSRSLKRMSPYDSSIVETHNGHIQKLRKVEREGWKRRVVASPVLEKVDAVAYPREILGEKNMHASSNIIPYGYNHMQRAKENDFLGYSGVRSSELNRSDSDACSVGSCSVTNQSPKNCYGDSMPVHCQEMDTLSSDAESSYGSGSQQRSSFLPPKEELEGYSWRHASFASNDLQMMPGFAAFLLALNFGRFNRLLSKRCYSFMAAPCVHVVVTTHAYVTD
ncbi:uncharacterized protein LOC105166821 isoform X3 [Sesamum indicum]|uniref:Uncharacterized protein LOC105166821 isoform X3 n=1 Tax=Sesamum indicum TaxID=4182 RepID=A0A8M8UR22_SESIN|nr:uncharacterized protein LOC105166821 isoform X3 [Sesamum indicum]